ncbi:MAG: hypothetical protein O2960_10905 [Verrucomicrobia bacterium]|nr:hypothetical protein [Verrucomicrobiota bacterium]
MYLGRRICYFVGSLASLVIGIFDGDYARIGRVTSLVFLWHLGFPNGGMAIIDVAACRPSPHPYYSMHLIGSAGAAYADDHHNAHLLFDKKGSHALLHARNEILGIRNLLEEFVNGIVEKRAWSVGVPDSVNACKTIEECAQA